MRRTRLRACSVCPRARALVHAPATPVVLAAVLTVVLAVVLAPTPFRA